MDWLPTLLALLLLGGLLCRADAAALESSTIPAEPEDPETSTVPITSLRMYHFDPPVKRRSFKVAPTPKPREEPPAQPQNATNRTLEAVQPRSGKLLLPAPPSHCYLNETKADDEEIVGWLGALPADRKLRLLKTLGYDPANCTRPRRRCSKKTPPEMRKSLTPPPALAKLPTTTPEAAEEPPATTTAATTSSTTPAPSTTTSTTTTLTTLTPETEELTTTEFVPRRRMLTPSTTTNTSTPDPSVTDESVTPGSSANTTTTTTSTTVAPPPKKEKSKCRKKKKAAAKKLKETND